jgi:acyl dehydratase
MLQQSHAGLPSIVWPYVKVLSSRKPMLAAPGIVMPALHIQAKRVHINAAHLRRYREICGLINNGVLPHAYLHVLAMPLHMCIFTHVLFPVKVLGLVHLRNVIRQWQPIPADATLQLSVECSTLRETDSGQEYDLVTRARRSDKLVWEEVSTMLARRIMSDKRPGKRPRIERAQRDESRLVNEQTVSATANTGRRYAFVSGDFNPIHLFDRTAQAFQFKQTVAHGMWSLARCIGLAESAFPQGAIELDAQFKLPVYLPSEFLFRSQRNEQSQNTIDLSLSTPKGDRLHLLVRAKTC